MRRVPEPETLLLRAPRGYLHRSSDCVVMLKRSEILFKNNKTQTRSFQINSISNWLLKWNSPSSSSISLFCHPLPCPTNPHMCHIPGFWALRELVYDPQNEIQMGLSPLLRFCCYCSPAHGKLQCKNKYTYIYIKTFKMPNQIKN